MSDFSYEIKERIGILSKNSSGWAKEFNIVSFNGGSPKYDIRDWSPDHKKMGKGISLTKEEAEVFSALVAQMYFDEKDNSKDKEGIESNVVQFKPKEKKIEKPKVKAKEMKVAQMNGVKFPF